VNISRATKYLQGRKIFRTEDVEKKYSTHIVKVKVKVKSMCTPRKHIGGAEVWLHSFLTCAMHEGKWLNSGPAAFRPGNNPGTDWIGDWAGSTGCLGVLQKSALLVLPWNKSGCLKRGTFLARTLLVCNVAGLA